MRTPLSALAAIAALGVLTTAAAAQARPVPAIAPIPPIHVHVPPVHVHVHVPNRRSDEPGPDSARVARFLTAIAGSDPMICEMAVNQLGNGWGWRGAGSGLGTFREEPAAERAALDSMSGSVSDRRALAMLASNLGAPSACVRRASATMLGESALPEAAQDLRAAYAGSNGRSGRRRPTGWGDRRTAFRSTR